MWEGRTVVDITIELVNFGFSMRLLCLKGGDSCLELAELGIENVAVLDPYVSSVGRERIKKGTTNLLGACARRLRWSSSLHRLSPALH